MTDNDNYIVDLYFTEPIKDANQAGKEVILLPHPPPSSAFNMKHSTTHWSHSTFPPQRPFISLSEIDAEILTWPCGFIAFGGVTSLQVPCLWDRRWSYHIISLRCLNALEPSAGIPHSIESFVHRPDWPPRFRVGNWGSEGETRERCDCTATSSPREQGPPGWWSAATLSTVLLSSKSKHPRGLVPGYPLVPRPRL